MSLRIPEALRFKRYELLLDSNLRHGDCDYRSVLPAGRGRSDAVNLIHAAGTVALCP